MANRSSKKYQEYWMVASGNQSFATSGNISTTGNSVNILDGQLGVIVAEPGPAHLSVGDFLNTTNNPAAAAANTASDVPAIQIVQGTPNSANNAGVQGWHYEDTGLNKSCVIRAEEVKSFTGALYRISEYSSVIVDAFGTPVDDTEYAIYPTLYSVRKDRDYGRNPDSIAVVHDTGTQTATDKKDVLAQNLLFKLNLRSQLLSGFSPSWKVTSGNKQVVGFGLNLGGAAGGTPIGAIEVGDDIPFVVYDGQTINFTADASFLQAVNSWIANSTNVTSATTIQPIDLTDTNFGEGVAAVGTFTITNNGNLGLDTFEVDGDNYVEATDWTDGATAADSATALAAAIDAGTASVNATASGNVVTITAASPGVAGNSITMSYTDSGSGVAATVSGATLSGGDATNVDAMVIMGLNHDRAAAYDDIYADKVNVEHTEFGRGFDADASLNKLTGSHPGEAFGSNRLMTIRYDERGFAQTGSQQLTGHQDEVLRAPSYIDSSTDYTVCVIDGITTGEQGIQHQYRVFILVPGTDDSASATAAGGITVTTSATNTKANINNILQPWILSNTGVSLHADSTTTALCP